MPDYAVVVQCFNKPDTLEAVCRALLACSSTERFGLVFWTDSPINSRDEARFAPAHRDVLTLLEELRPELEGKFASVEIHKNMTNLGPYKTCKLALDHTFKTYNFVVFTEDDGIFAPDALEWFLACSRTDEFALDRTWAISGESIFFDAREKNVDSCFIQAAIAYVRTEQLADKFAEIGFIPSTCFATSLTKWAEIGETRGQTNGDVDLCRRCEIEQKTCIQPIVARVRDVGMLHDLGYSVSIHSRAGVSEIKNTYVTSAQLYVSGAYPSFVCIIDQSRNGDIYRRSTLLEGFNGVYPILTSAPITSKDEATPPSG